MVPEKHVEDGLNEHHLRRLLVSCQYIDHLLSEIENVLNTANSQAVFPKYFIDISPAERQVIEKHEARIRRQLLRLVQRHGITHQPGIPARRAIHSILAVAQISAEELNPRHLRGYGKVPESAGAVLKPLVGELQDLIAALDQFVIKPHGRGAEPER
ncbi:MAG TPA: hypothetical protein VN810_06000 [Terriglobales bacterium]|nr:hypothetical protein [Terriglobales bacterium]